MHYVIFELMRHLEWRGSGIVIILSLIKLQLFGALSQNPTRESVDEKAETINGHASCFMLTMSTQNRM